MATATPTTRAASTRGTWPGVWHNGTAFVRKVDQPALDELRTRRLPFRYPVDIEGARLAELRIDVLAIARRDGDKLHFSHRECP